MSFLPLLVTNGIVLFPKTSQPIEIGRSISIAAIEKALESKNQQILVTTQKKLEIEYPDLDQIYKFGTLAKIENFKKQEDGGYKVELVGISRVKLSKIQMDENGFYVSEKKVLKDTNLEGKEIEDKVAAILEAIQSYEQNTKGNTNSSNILKETKNPGLFVDRLFALMPIAFAKKQKALEELDVSKRIDLLVQESGASSHSHNTNTSKSNIQEETKINKEIDQKVSDNLSKQQREFYLRERLKAIREELGEIGSKDNDVDSIRAKLDSHDYPESVKKRVKEELIRYESTPPSSQESNIILTYVNWLMDLPWWQKTVDNEDIIKVKKELDKSHYGLEKIKDRILEYIAVKNKSKNSKSPIMCLVGPPGVGKTSLAQSIARALDKKFVKMSLGGVKDESEIRGHRKTYLGSLPGRIIQGMKKAETINPLFLLDEIDKMSSDYRGDPTSAMLEVLDPEQNKIFSDNYIEEDYDLSNVMFVATANYYEQIPEPLIDRMEIIEISSYTALEKLQIAKNHLVPKVLKDCGLNKKEITYTDSAISYLINFYTRESGVRELERLISKIARKFIVKQSKKEMNSIKVDEKIVKEFLGKEIFETTEKDKVSIPGVVNGMAYTTVGGDLLPIEVTLFPGKGNIIVTGNLKETMKESASVALGFVRSNYKNFNIESDIFKDNDFHIHVPQGGVPKDGPSAGVALTSAIISAIKKHKVSTKISMTGEITLRGKVLTIGGLKEKIISAHRGGVREIFIPHTNERHLEDVPKEVMKDIKVNLINNYEEIFNKLFVK